MAIYGRTFNIIDLTKGTVEITQPTHGSISTNISSGYVGETCRIYSSMDKGYAISYYLVNGSKINGSSFKLVSGSNAITAVETTSSDSETTTYYTLTLMYEKDGVIDNSLTATKEIAKNSYVNVNNTNYLLNDTNYTLESISPSSSFYMTSNRTITYSYSKKEVDYNPFDYMNISCYKYGEWDFEVMETAPFETVDINFTCVSYTSSSASSETTASYSLSLDINGHDHEAVSIGSNVYSKITCKAKTNLKNASTYTKSFENGTKPSDEITVPIKIYINGTHNKTVEQQYKIGDSFSMSELGNSLNPDSSKYDYSGSNISATNATVYNGMSIELYYKTKSTTTDTYYTLTVNYYTGGSLYTNNTYSIKSGTVVSPSSYKLSSAPSGYEFDSCSPSSSFTMSSDKTISIYYITSFSLSAPSLSASISSGSYKLSTSSLGSTTASAVYSLTSGTAKVKVTNNNSTTVNVTINGSSCGTLSSGSSETYSVSTTGSIRVSFSATVGGKAYTSSNSASVATSLNKSIYITNSDGTCNLTISSGGLDGTSTKICQAKATVSGDKSICSYSTKSGTSACCSNQANCLILDTGCPITFDSVSWDSTITV